MYKVYHGARDSMVCEDMQAVMNQIKAYLCVGYTNILITKAEVEVETNVDRGGFSIEMKIPLVAPE